MQDPGPNAQLARHFLTDSDTAIFGASHEHEQGRVNVTEPASPSEETRIDRVVTRLRNHLSGPVGEALIIGVGLALAYWALRMSPIVAIGAFRDDAIYISLGKALASHEGYRSIYMVGAPIQMKYPPGLPAIYALFWWLGGTLARVEVMAMTLDLVVCGIAAGLIWWIGRARMGLSVPVTLAFAILPFFLDSSIQYFNLAISEPYFVLAWAAALVLHYRIEDAGPGNKSVGLGLALGLLMAAVTLIRVQAVVLIPAFALALIVRRASWRVLGIFSVSALAPVSGWFWLQSRLAARGPVSTHPDEVPYLAWIPWDQPIEVLRFFASAAGWNWEEYWRVMPLNLSGSWVVGALLGGVFLLLSVAGGVVLVKRHPALALTTAASAALVMVWPFPQDRFLMPILPFAGLLMAAAIARATQRWRFLSGRTALAALAVLAMVIAERQFSIRRYAFSGEDPVAETGVTYASYYLATNTRYLSILSRWTLENTSPEDIMLVDFPAGLFLYTGRRGVASEPAENQVAPTAFRSPGEFLTRLIIEDSVSVIGLGNLRAPIAAEIATVQRRCPDALDFLGSPSAGSVPAFYRVVPGNRCVKALAREFLGVEGLDVEGG
jgi:hypothetical protein